MSSDGYKRMHERGRLASNIVISKMNKCINSKNIIENVYILLNQYIKLYSNNHMYN